MSGLPGGLGNGPPSTFATLLEVSVSSVQRTRICSVAGCLNCVIARTFCSPFGRCLRPEWWMCNFLVATLREVSTYLRIRTDGSWAFHFMAKNIFRWPEGCCWVCANCGQESAPTDLRTTAEREPSVLYVPRIPPRFHVGTPSSASGWRLLQDEGCGQKTGPGSTSPVREGEGDIYTA